jgi:sulfite reductase (NADPH) flavoprotein alpha-component
MVGPGTGIAPFRAFIEDRAETECAGENWLFFGDQNYNEDFLYQTELQDYLKEGYLSRLDVAFSRDQPEKIYVQHKMLENASEIWRWLETGAHFYVCGDASRMAKDVHDTLLRIIETQGDMNADDAAAYLTALKKDKRYQRDVY